MALRPLEGPGHVENLCGQSFRASGIAVGYIFVPPSRRTLLLAKTPKAEADVPRRCHPDPLDHCTSSRLDVEPLFLVLLLLALAAPSFRDRATLLLLQGLHSLLFGG